MSCVSLSLAKRPNDDDSDNVVAATTAAAIDAVPIERWAIHKIGMRN